MCSVTMMCWGPMTQLLCGSHLYLCVLAQFHPDFIHADSLKVWHCLEASDSGLGSCNPGSPPRRGARGGGWAVNIGQAGALYPTVPTVRQSDSPTVRQCPTVDDSVRQWTSVPPSGSSPTGPTVVRQWSDSRSDSPTADSPTDVRQLSDSSDSSPTVPTVPTARAQACVVRVRVACPACACASCTCACTGVCARLGSSSRCVSRSVAWVESGRRKRNSERADTVTEAIWYIETKMVFVCAYGPIRLDTQL